MAVHSLPLIGRSTTPLKNGPIRAVGDAEKAVEQVPEGMTHPRVWRRSEVHMHSTYSCAKCRRRPTFKTPFAFYRHLDSEHPAKKRHQLKVVK